MNKAKPMTKGKISGNRGEFTDMFIFMMKQDTIRKLEKLKTTLINRMCFPNKPVNTFENAREQIDFAEGSKVIVVGRTTQSKKKDQEGNVTEEMGDVTINVMGLYAIPEYKISLPENVKPLNQINLDIE